jgi:glycogen synthase
MKALFLTNEYPPYVYGGAGVHVDYLSRELARTMPIEVRAFGDQQVDLQNLRVRGFAADTGAFTAPKPLHSVFAAVQRCTNFNATGIDAEVVHCHTWYSHFGGILAKLNYGIPLVITVHSLEPLRPWKREQLGGGYDFTVWLEKTALEMADAVIAVSSDTRSDLERLFDIRPERLHVIYNGIDLEEYRKVATTAALARYGIDPAQPFVLFVGRITRQKGIVHLVHAIEHMAPGFQVVLCAGAPDTPEIAREMEEAVAQASARRPGVIWIREMVDKATVYELYSHAAVFCCPSVYEPFGIINLEAMACETAVVASAVGGIKEVVVDGETGFLVPLELKGGGGFEPVDAEQFARDLAARINTLMTDAELRERFGKAGRKRAEEKFSWRAIAEQTRALYASLLTDTASRVSS